MTILKQNLTVCGCVFLSPTSCTKVQNFIRRLEVLGNIYKCSRDCQIRKSFFFVGVGCNSFKLCQIFLPFFLAFRPAFLSALLPSFVPLAKALRVQEGKNPLFISARPPKRINIIEKKENLNKYISIIYFKRSQKISPGVA